MPEAQNAPILTWEELFRQRALWQKQGLKVVFTNGVFDLLHRGHLDYLQAARQLGDVLIIGVNTDSSVKRFKEPGRPLVAEGDRAFALSCLRQVDAVTLFDQDTPLVLITRLKPEVLVKGADYEEKDIVGAKEVKETGGQVVRIALTEGRSTTDLIHTILQKHGRA
ncbi:MAG TPA: D-glycero-beta-D-manno-heptose 1-phosphate adenylyltransferase [bacterium]|jgi:rfaE bifunctional protein nucleotidyltransferase chain/domain